MAGREQAARWWARLAGLRTRPHPVERWLWISACFALAFVTFDFSLKYGQAQRAITGVTYECGSYYLSHAASLFIRVVFGLVVPVVAGIAALLSHRQWLKEIVLAATLPVGLVQLVATDWLLTNLRLNEATSQLIPYTKQHALASVVLTVWLFILLLRDVLPEGRETQIGQ